MRCATGCGNRRQRPKTRRIKILERGEARLSVTRAVFQVHLYRADLAGAAGDRKLRRHLEHPTRIVGRLEEVRVEGGAEVGADYIPDKTTLRIIEREAREARGAGIVIAGDCDGERIRLA